MSDLYIWNTDRTVGLCTIALLQPNFLGPTISSLSAATEQLSSSSANLPDWDVILPMSETLPTFGFVCDITHLLYHVIMLH